MADAMTAVTLGCDRRHKFSATPGTDSPYPHGRSLVLKQSGGDINEVPLGHDSD